MNNLKAVIFDLDNTLLDRTSTFYQFTAALVAHYFRHIQNIEPIIDRIIDLDQDGYKDKRALFDELLEELPWHERPERNELLDYYSLHYVKNACIMDHAIEMIQYVRKTYKVGLITNGRTSIQYGKIDQLGIRNFFDIILVSEEVGIKKPHARIFEMALERMNVAASQCVYIGDHPVNDIEEAGKAGMNTIWLEVNQPWNEEVTVQPNYRINRLRDLANIL